MSRSSAIVVSCSHVRPPSPLDTTYKRAARCAKWWGALRHAKYRRPSWSMTSRLLLALSAWIGPVTAGPGTTGRGDPNHTFIEPLSAPRARVARRYAAAMIEAKAVEHFL